MSDPLATYGQLVTPNPQAPAATTGSSSSGGGGNPPAQAAAARLSSNGDGAGGLGPGPAPTSSVPGSSGASRQTSLGALLGSEASGDIASPHLPEAVAKPCLLAITVGDPVKKDSAGVFGMKGEGPGMALGILYNTPLMLTHILQSKQAQGWKEQNVRAEHTG